MKYKYPEMYVRSTIRIPKRKKNGWTLKTLPKCALVHLDSISNAYYNLCGKAKWKKIGSLIEHYKKMRESVMVNEKMRVKSK